MIIFKMIAVWVTAFTATYLALWLMSHTPPLEDVSIKPIKAPEVVTDSFERLLDAIEWVESKCDSQAVGDNGNAVGSFQIWKIMVDDVNRILKGRKMYTYRDRTSRIASRNMCRIYFTHYCDGMSYEDMARCWVSGPQGYKKDCSIPYGRKVIKRMKGM